MKRKTIILSDDEFDVTEMTFSVSTWYPRATSEEFMTADRIAVVGPSGFVVVKDRYNSIDNQLRLRPLEEFVDFLKEQV